MSLRPAKSYRASVGKAGYKEAGGISARLFYKNFGNRRKAPEEGAQGKECALGKGAGPETDPQSLIITYFIV